MHVAATLARAFKVEVTDEKHETIGRECYSKLFYLQYTITQDAFMVEDIDITVRGRGHGRQLVELIWSFCEQKGLDLYANFVLADAVGFWETMGLKRDPEDPINFVRRQQKIAA